MSDDVLRFPDYGDSGDLAGARRSRHAFRLCVVATVFVTGMLYISERFLQYEETERQYLSALTLPRESARVFLKQAKKRDMETREKPTARYAQALAVREEEDVMLSAFSEAYEMDRSNSLFALRFGARLYVEGEAERAVQVFRRAQEFPPENAFAAYLEAASLALSSTDEEVLDQAMVLVARTNNSGHSVIYPRPLWFSGLPQDGLQYASLSRGIIQEFCGPDGAPLHYFPEQVVARVRERLENGQTKNARTWLRQIQVMGERLADSAEPSGTLQAIRGIEIQLTAIGVLERLTPASVEGAGTELLERRVKLDQALALLNTFEAGREQRIEEDRFEVFAPLRLYGWGGAVVFAAYLFAYLVYKLMRLRKSAWAVPHSLLGKGILCGGSALLYAVLMLLMLFQFIPGSQAEYISFAGTMWWGILGVLCVFGWMYPALTLLNVGEVSRRSGRVEEIEDTMPFARKAYRRAYVSLALRYYGILLGLFVCVACAWTITFRITSDLYPWQVQLLADGLLNDEAEAAKSALGSLE